jgi:hypothetical protein
VGMRIVFARISAYPPVRSKDCGGDCQECMASFYDPHAMAALHAIDPERYPLDD